MKMVLSVVRLKMAMDFDSKEVELMLDERAIHRQPTYCYGTVEKSELMFGLKVVHVFFLHVID